ncbi:MAG: hypothetical protein KBS86_00815 [Proteobacteria bacterium]|nr:hypothetical protein [Candidatus Enterousia scatequi]
MFRHLLSILSLLCMIVSPAVADLASVSHVNSMRDNVQAKIDKKADNANYTQNMVLQTDNSGNVVATTVGTDLFADGAIETIHLADGAVTNADLAGMIDITKLNLGTLPTSGKHMMIWNATTNEYVFEKYADSASSGLQCSAGTYDIGFSSCINASTGGSDYGYINDSVHGWYPDSSNESVYGLTQDNTWGVTLYTGDKIKGEALCSSTPGTYAKPGNPDEAFDEENSLYCWCKMTEPSVSRWVFNDYYVFFDAGTCAYACASFCADYVQSDSGFRSGVFGSVGN